MRPAQTSGAPRSDVWKRVVACSAPRRTVNHQRLNLGASGGVLLERGRDLHAADHHALVQRDE